MRDDLLVSDIALDNILNFDHDSYSLHVFVYHSISCGFGRKYATLIARNCSEKS